MQKKGEEEEENMKQISVISRLGTEASSCSDVHRTGGSQKLYRWPYEA
jgi:hypothetical protein